MNFDWWTLGIQAVNVLILIWLLRRFFWGPVAAAIARRQTEMQAALAAADAKEKAAQDALAEIQATRAGFAGEREAMLAEARTAAEALAGTARAEALKAIEALRVAAKADIARRDALAAEQRADRAAELGLAVAGRLAARLSSPVVRGVFLDWLLAEVKAMSEAERQALAGSAAGVDLISAEALDAAAQAGAVDALKTAIGDGAVIRVTVDPALIAGFELHAPHFILRNSWQADLETIRREVLNVA